MRRDCLVSQYCNTWKTGVGGNLALDRDPRGPSESKCCHLRLKAGEWESFFANYQCWKMVPHIRSHNCVVTTNSRVTSRFLLWDLSGKSFEHPQGALSCSIFNIQVCFCMHMLAPVGPPLSLYLPQLPYIPIFLVCLPSPTPLLPNFLQEILSPSCCCSVSCRNRARIHL